MAPEGEVQNIKHQPTKERPLKRVDELSLALDSATELISIIDKDYRFIRVNRAMAEAIGRPPDDCVGLYCYAAIHGRTTPYESCPHQQTINTLQPAEAEIEVQQLGKHLKIKTTPFFTPDGMLSGTVHGAYDITSLIQKQKIITEQAQQLKDLNNQLEARITIATHELREANRKLRTLFQQKEKVCENERKILAREVHDEIGQMLIAVKFELARLNKDNSPSSESLKIIDTIKGEVDLIISKTQQIIANLRPATLDNLDLCDAIKSVAKEFTGHTDIPCQVKLCTLPPPLTKEQETTLFRIAQEALNNIERHAAARQVTIGSESNGKFYTYFIADNGRGITDQELLASDSFGIMGIYEHAQLVGAKAEVSARPEGGTIVQVHIPI